jgi:ABC-type transporter MlaC component
MNSKLLRSSLLALIALAWTASAQAGSDPVKRTEELVKAFKAVKPLPEDGTPLSAAEKKANAAAFKKLDSFFDYDHLTTAPVAPHKAKFSGGQLKTFTDEFRQLIRLVAYPNSGDFLGRAKYTLKVGKKREGKKQVDVDMHATLEEEDLQTTVTFHWKESASGMRIIDVSFDGASLIKDYTNQFSRIISKDGITGLLSKVHKRLEKEQKESVAAL